MFHFNVKYAIFFIFSKPHTPRESWVKMYKTLCLTSVLWQTLSPTDPHLKCQATYLNPCLDKCEWQTHHLFVPIVTPKERLISFFVAHICPFSAFTGRGVLSWQIKKKKETAQSLGCWWGPFPTQLLRWTTIKHCRNFNLSFLKILFMKMFWTPVTPGTKTTTVCWTSVSKNKWSSVKTQDWQRYASLDVINHSDGGQATTATMMIMMRNGLLFTNQLRCKRAEIIR